MGGREGGREGENLLVQRMSCLLSIQALPLWNHPADLAGKGGGRRTGSSVPSSFKFTSCSSNLIPTRSNP